MSTALDQRVATNGNTANRARRPEALTVWALSSPGEASAKKQNGSRSSRFVDCPDAYCGKAGGLTPAMSSITRTTWQL